MKSHIITVAFVSLMLYACGSRDAGENMPLPPAITEVHDMGKLRLAEMTITKMGTIDDLKLKDAHNLNEKTAAIINSLKIGNRKGAWSYDTYLSAYIDLSLLTADDVTVDTLNRTATVRLPHIETEMTGRDIEMREEHYRVSGLRSNISAEERATLKEKMNQHLKQEVASNAEFETSLRRKAEERGRAWIDSLYASRGYSVIVTFK